MLPSTYGHRTKVLSPRSRLSWRRTDSHKFDRLEVADHSVMSYYVRPKEGPMFLRATVLAVASVFVLPLAGFACGGSNPASSPPSRDAGTDGPVIRQIGSDAGDASTHAKDSSSTPPRPPLDRSMPALPQ